MAWSKAGDCRCEAQCLFPRTNALHHWRNETPVDNEQATMHDAREFDARSEVDQA